MTECVDSTTKGTEKNTNTAVEELMGRLCWHVGPPTHLTQET